MTSLDFLTKDQEWVIVNEPSPSFLVSHKIYMAVSRKLTDRDVGKIWEITDEQGQPRRVTSLLSAGLLLIPFDKLVRE